MGRKPKYTAQEVADALTAARGMEYLAAEKLGCSHTTVGNYVNKFACCKKAKEDARGKFKDIAEVKLMDAVIAGEAWAIKFALQMLGDDRGYVPKQGVRLEGTGEGGAIVVQNVELTDAERRAALRGMFGLSDETGGPGDSRDDQP